MASTSRLLRANAIIDGRKYITSPKLPKNGKKKNVERIMRPSFSISLALSRVIQPTRWPGAIVTLPVIR
jgi:hypothetical protein